jgi:two-component system, cell cycle sensor histidine kinase and response regulator CckA
VTPLERTPAPETVTGRRILVVEDDEAICLELADVLAEIGHAVITAGDGQDALQALSSGPLPDLIVLDLRLPVMDGWQFRVHQRRSKLWADIPVIAISADATPQAEAIDADYFLRKPFRGEVLQREVSRVLAIVDRERARTARQALADRLASLGTLAAGVGHEINNPLAYVIGNLDFVSEQLRAMDAGTPVATRDLQQAIGEIREGANRIKRIVRDLRIFARRDEEQRVPTDLRPVLELAANMSFPEIRHRARLVKDFGPTPTVAGDDARLAQLFINLLVNAAQAIPEGQADRNEIRIRTGGTAQGWAFVEIHDTGPGIPDSVRARIFDPFVTTKDVGLGTGLGLSICHGIVKAHGGDISFESDPQTGTTFRVSLPPSGPEDAGGRRTSPAEVVSPAGRRGNILIVDDDPSIVAALRRTLVREHDVTVADGGRQAWEMLVQGQRFDVVLCDLMMPEVTGMDLYDQLGELDPGQRHRMVFLTGGAFTLRAQNFLELVPNPRLEKPFDGLSLRALVRSLVR